MRPIKSITALEDLGRVRLSKSFYMREFLYSEVGNFHGIPNIPENPDMLIESGQQLCENLLEPLQDSFGRIAIRSAYRSKEVNGFCNEMQRQNKKGYSCASNESNYAGHIWDIRDNQGNLGATVSIVVPKFADIYNNNGGVACWTELAWWIHDNLPYHSMFFFPINAAFNITWRENPERRIDSYVAPRGTLTKAGMSNHESDHSLEYPNITRLLNS